MSTNRPSARMVGAMVFVGAVLMAACSSSVSSTWVGADDDTTVFIQWSRDGSSVTGTLRVAQAAGVHLLSASADVTGTIVGNDLALIVDPRQQSRALSSAGLEGHVTGRVNSRQVVLTVAGESGTLREFVLTPGDVPVYNDATAVLQARVDESRAVQAAEVERHLEADRVRAAEQEAERQQRAAADERLAAQQAVERATQTIEYHLASGSRQLALALQRLTGPMDREIAALERELAAATSDFDRNFVIAMQLDGTIQYHREAVLDDLRVVREHVTSAWAVGGPSSEALADRIAALGQEADDVERQLTDRWNHAIRVAESAT